MSVLLHVHSGETYPVSFFPLRSIDIELLMSDWEEDFDWTIYFGVRDNEVYKMVVTGDPIIQGAIALERREGHVFVHLIEAIPKERKAFKQIGLHLMAFACKRSKELGFDGAVAFNSKSSPELRRYYIEDVGAENVAGNLMVIHEDTANDLIVLYLS